MQVVTQMDVATAALPLWQFHVKKIPDFFIRNDTNDTYTLLAVCGLTPQSGDGFEAIQEENRWLEDGRLTVFSSGDLCWGVWFLEKAPKNVSVFFGDWWIADLGWGRITWIKVFVDFTWILWCFMSCCERKRRCFNRLRRWIFGPDFLLSFKKEHFQPSPIWILFFQMGKFQFAIQTFSGKSWLSWSQNWPSACQPLTCLPKWSCSKAQFLLNISALQ